MKKTIGIIILIIILILIGISFSGENNEGVSGDVIKIGYSGIQSGPLAWFGELYYEGLHLAKTEINESGGINDVPIEIIIEDNEYTGKGGVDSFRALQAKGADIVISMGTVPTVTLSPVAAETDTPVMATAVLADVLSGNPNAVRMTFLPELDAGTTVKDMLIQGDRKVGVLYINNELGLANLEAFRSEIENTGIEVVYEESYSPSTVEFGTPVLKTLDNDIDSVYVIDIGYVGVVDQLQRQIGDDDVQIYINYIAYTGNTVIKNPAVFEGVHMTVPTISIPESDNRNKLISKLGINEEEALALTYQALAYDNLHAIATVLEVGGVEGFVENFSLYGEFEGANGIYNLNSRDVGVPVLPAVFSDGKLSLVE